jgi:DNA polymerase III sliding clamp (beta) subunit (PCNA family)
MKFKIQTDILKAAVDTVSRATVVSAITPVLENILIDATMGRIVFSGNNLEMAIEYTITEKMTVELE